MVWAIKNTRAPDGSAIDGDYLTGEMYGERSTTHPLIGRALLFASESDARLWMKREQKSNCWSVVEVADA